jgi:hypothetical protein
MQSSNTAIADSRDVDWPDSRAHHRHRHTHTHTTTTTTTTTTMTAQRRRAATRRHCTSSLTCHETASQPLLKLARIATTAVGLLPLTAAATAQSSAVPHTGTPQHSNTLPLTQIKEQHAQRHPNTQRCSTLDVLVTTAVTHKGGAALHTRPRPRAAASSAVTLITQHFHHGVAAAVGSYTTAVRQWDCNMHDHSTRVALARSTDCQRSHAQRNTAPPL